MSPILLADDDGDEAYLVVRAFKDAGVAHPVVVVPDGEAAIRYLEGRGEYADRFAHPPPRLLMLDQKLPGRSGLEVLEWVRNGSGSPTLPVLVLSASTYDCDVQAAYLVGANGYLVKPATYEETVEMARAVNAFWLTFNRAPAGR
jgi:CheY-like chemotaxis protein